MRTIKNNYRKDIKMIKAGSTTLESIQRREEEAQGDDDEEEEEKKETEQKKEVEPAKEKETPSKRINSKRNYSAAFEHPDFELDDEEQPVQSIFVYGSLRPDDDSRENQTKRAIAGMIHQKAVIKDA